MLMRNMYLKILIPKGPTDSPRSPSYTRPWARRTLATLILALAITAALCLPVLAGDFRASRKSDKFHYPDCRFIRQILESNLIRFTSPEDAIKAGYSPCKACKPPMKSTPASH